MAVETTRVFNYLYLNESLNDLLKNQHFNRVSKVNLNYLRALNEFFYINYTICKGIY
jgi:hypothetical protein